MRIPILIYTANTSERLLYVLDWVFNQRLHCGYKLTGNIKDLKGTPFSIAYGNDSPGYVTIPASGLLFERSIRQHEIKTGNWNSIPTMYVADDNNYAIPFDIFSAIFFLLSRYEEYYPYTSDKHNRYPATASILYKNNWLERPLVDEWIAAFRHLLIERFQQEISAPSFSFLPTYDIDIAYSYKHKGIARNTGGFLKSVATGDMDMAKERISVIAGGQQDPFDSFEFISALHRRFHYKPIYFILAALQPGPFDKNISPMHPVMQELIHSFANEGEIGMHPSYDTDINKERFEEEKSILENVSGRAITISRQHYVKMVLPATYRKLLSEGIRTDYSMGYGTHLGFRAGTGAPFYWYDIETETITDLLIYPFCFMDSTAHYENKLSAVVAFERLDKMTQILNACNSMLITVFHNFSLGTAAEWNEWPEHYEAFLKKMAE